jgi:hypothetical protein
MVERWRGKVKLRHAFILAASFGYAVAFDWAEGSMEGHYLGAGTRDICDLENAPVGGEEMAVELPVNISSVPYAKHD